MSENIHVKEIKTVNRGAAMGGRLMAAVVAVVCLALMACGGKTEAAADASPESELKKTIPVEVKELKSGPFTESGVYYGRVQGVSEATLVSYGGGLVSSIRVSAGQYVREGKSLCSIDGEKFSTASESAQLQRKIAEDDYNRAKTHLEKGTYSQLQVDRARQSYLQAKQMSLDAEKHRKGALCISPISGTVTQVSIDKNQNLGPGTPTVSIAALNQIKIKLAVPENEIAGFARRGRALVTLPGSGEAVTGRIFSLSQQVIASNRSFEVEVRFPNKNKVLKPGQTVSVEIFKAPLEAAIVIPSEAILSLQKGSAVMVASGGFARLVMVAKGPANATKTVIQSGLQEGDKLIIKGHALVSDGSPIQIKPSPEEISRL
jgi:membrane fusion protein (multidrug efflux system)